MESREQISPARDGIHSSLRRTLFRYKLHKDAELFEKAYGSVKE